MKKVMLRSRIRELRAREGLTQEQLAGVVDVRRETIGHIEHGRYNPSLILAYLISRALKSTIEDVFSFHEGESQDG